MLVVARKAGLGPEDVAALPRLDTVPFSSERRYMATLHADRAGRRCVVLAKGAIERILEVCGAEMGADGATRPVDRDAALHAADELATEGLRVLATAVRFGPRGHRPRRGRRYVGTWCSPVCRRCWTRRGRPPSTRSRRAMRPASRSR